MPLSRYRLEFQRADRVQRTYVLGVLTGRTPTRGFFDPYVSRLLLTGLRGTLVAVDMATGETVLRRQVQPARPRMGRLVRPELTTPAPAAD